jgi:hypothetical protein
MVLPLVLISVLSAPRAPAEAELVAYVPRLEQVSTLMPFLNAAGSKSALLRPEAWRSDMHPLIDLDVVSKDSLITAGIDPAGSLTSSRIGDYSFSCVTLGSVEAFRKLADAKLARLGQVFEKTEAGVSLYASRDPVGRVLAAYSVAGKESCAVFGHGLSVEKQFTALAKATTKPAPGPGFALGSKLPGALQVVDPAGTPHGAISISAKELTLTADSKLKGTNLMQLAGAGPSPYGALSTHGLAVVRARAAKAQLPELIQQVLRYAPGSATLGPLAKEVAPLLTGNTALVVSHARVTTGLRTKEARFFALRFAVLAEVTDAAAVSALLEKVEPKSLAFREGTLTLGLEGTTLVVSNDNEARSKAVAALAKADGKQARGLEFEVDPKLVAKALQQVPLLEAVQTPELAGLVAVSAELGPLLLASERVSGHLDSTGTAQHTGRLTWRLDPAKFNTDAGTP